MKYEQLKLDNQLCFPLYAASRAVVNKYSPYLNELGLTYTQYITMMVIWEENEVTVKHLGERLYLDSGTLSPLINALIKKGYIEKNRSVKDERTVIISVTEKGKKLEDLAAEIPFKIASCIKLSQKDAKDLYRILHQII